MSAGAVARWCVKQGAEGIALVGRRGASGPGGQAFVEELRALGVQVRAFAVDSADAPAVGKMLRALDDDKKLPALRSIFHAAGVADGDFLAALDEERFAATLAGKVGGAWNLHRATRRRVLDHFVLFSSIMATIDVPANANYGAANAWLDGLAERRRAVGLPATSIAWGPWQQVGMATDRGAWIERLEAGGMEPVPTRTALACLGRLLAAGVTRAAVTRVDVARWREAFVAATADPFLPVAEGEGPEPASNLLERLAALDDADLRREALRGLVRDAAAGVLRFSAEQGLAQLDARHRPRPPHPGSAAGRRPTQPHQPTQRLPLPPALRAGRTGVQPAGAAAGGGRGRPRRGLPGA